MLHIIELLQNILELGLLYALVALSVYISSRLLSFDDLSVEGSFGVGGALAALLITHNALYAVFPVVLVCGALVGMCTGLLHTKLRMNNLISGIVVTAACFSVNLKIAGPNMSLFAAKTVFSYVNGNALFLLLPLVCIVFVLIDWFLKTEVGLLLKSVGCNPQMLTNLAKNIDFYLVGGLMLSNALTALAGALFVQHLKFFSITSSIGILVIALAGVIIGQALLGSWLPGLIVGSVAYQALMSTTIEMQIDPLWNKAITSLLIVLLVILSHKKKTLFAR